jgi:hypothetical protein
MGGELAEWKCAFEVDCESGPVGKPRSEPWILAELMARLRLGEKMTGSAASRVSKGELESPEDLKRAALRSLSSSLKEELADAAEMVDEDSLDSPEAPMLTEEPRETWVERGLRGWDFLREDESLALSGASVKSLAASFMN